MAGTLTDLTVAARLAGKAIARRLRSDIEPPPNLDDFTRGMGQLLETAPTGIIRDSAWLSMPASQPPWVSCGLHLEPGDEISYFIAGRAYANKALDIYVSPELQVWCRIGAQGPIFRGTRTTHSFRAETGGELYFGNYFPNDWADSSGNRKQDDAVYKEVSGELRILAIRWAGSAAEGLAALAGTGDYAGLLMSELQRLRHPPAAPEGWTYLWHLGPAEIFTKQPGEDGQACIHCRTHADVGILQRPVDLPLADDSEISWRWRVDELPIDLREDSVPSHDYLSIAVEFDNGRDITYYWSSQLPEGTGYDCPLPNWRGKEYHVVIRSGTGGLGEWLAERRNLMDDYRHYMGDPPARITRVWFIANSIFQRGTGECTYADIVLQSGGQKIQVL